VMNKVALGHFFFFFGILRFSSVSILSLRNVRSFNIGHAQWPARGLAVPRHGLTASHEYDTIQRDASNVTFVWSRMESP
jgi:hypothetical protein